MEIRFLLEKYAQLGFAQKQTKEIILKILQNDFHIDILSKEIEIKETEVRIKVSGVRKTHITLNKHKIEEAILNELKEKGIFISKIY